MKCGNCGASYGSELARCPYCGSLNDSVSEYNETYNDYAENYRRTEEALIENRTSKVLKYTTIIMLCVYAAVFALTCFLVSRVNDAVSGKSSIIKNSPAQQRNEKLFKEYMDKGQYARALTLVNETDLSMYADSLTGFEYYSEYEDALTTIFSYVNIYNEVLFVIDDMENSDDFRSLTENQLLSYHIFYETPDSELKQELQTEIEGYLKNLYRLTDEEIRTLRGCEDYMDFQIEGSSDYETITKQRMVDYFE